MKIVNQLLGALALAASMLAPHAVQAQEWPAKPVRVVVGFPAGGTNDIVARVLAQRLSERLGKAFVVENRAGVGGNLGADVVAKAAPDGYTLGLVSNGAMATNRFLYKSMPFDADKDLTPIVLVGEVPILFVAHPAVPANNLKELVALSKQRPGQINVGTPGNGTIGHLTLALVNVASGAGLQHVPYRGDALALTDLIGGNIQAVAGPAIAYLQQVQGGKVKALGITSSKRVHFLPDTPTARELGIDAVASSLIAVVGPAGLPRNIVERINREVNIFAQSPEGRATLTGVGVEPLGGSPEAMASVMADEVRKWKRIVEASGARLD